MNLSGLRITTEMILNHTLCYPQIAGSRFPESNMVFKNQSALRRVGKSGVWNRFSPVGGQVLLDYKPLSSLQGQGKGKGGEGT